MARPSDSERKLAYDRLSVWIITGVLIAVFGFLAVWPAIYAYEAASLRAAVQGISEYVYLLFIDMPGIIVMHASWGRKAIQQSGFLPVSWFVPVVFGISLSVWRGVIANPYSFDRDDFGSARWMRYRDLVERDLFSPTGIVLGRWGNSWKLVRNWETLSAMIIAPPGTAKTVQLIANILADWPDTAWLKCRNISLLKFIPGVKSLSLPLKVRAPVPGPSMIINDPKGEMYAITAGWRSRIGRVYRLSWGDAANSHHWNPLSPLSYAGGEEYVRQRAAVIEQLGAIFEAPDRALPGILKAARDGRAGKWIVEQLIGDVAEGTAALESLAGRLKEGVSTSDAFAVISDIETDIMRVRSLNSSRETHLERLAAILISESVEAHWRTTGRTFLIGAMGFIMARCERTNEEPTFGRLLDDLNTTSINGAGFTDPIESIHEDGEHVYNIPGLGSEADPSGGDGDDDQIAMLLRSWIEEAKVFGYPERFINDLQETLNKPDRERGSVISTAGSSVNIFKNAEVRSVTSSSDFRLADIRQIDGRPVTYYMVVSLEDAEYLGRLTGLFMETHAAFAISQDASEIKKTSRPLIFFADEFWTMPPLQALLQIPALGRGQWVQLVVVGQSFGQIATKYRQLGGDQVVKTLRSAISYIISFTQNDLSTAKEVSDSIGKTTVKQVSTGRQGFSFSSQGRGVNYNESYQARPLVDPEQIMSMEKLDPEKNMWGWLIFQMTGAMNRPVQLRPVAWFKHPKLVKRAGLKVIEWEDAEAVSYSNHRDTNQVRRIGEPMINKG